MFPLSHLSRTHTVIIVTAISVTLLLVVPLILFLTLRHRRAPSRPSDPEALLPVVKLQSRDSRRVQMEMQMPVNVRIAQDEVRGVEVDVQSAIDGPAFGTGKSMAAMYQS
jgi:low affinity Fe/Cu permease